MVDISVMLNTCFPGEAFLPNEAPCSRCGVMVQGISVVDSFDQTLKSAKEIHAAWHVMIEA
jgi:hypothetical protein